MTNKTLHLPVVLRLNFGFHALELQAASDDATKQPFLATVTYAGLASDGPVGGTEVVEGGPYKILIPVALMEKRVEELKGKGVFAAESLDTHSGAERIGTFTNAYLQRFIGTEIHAVNGGGFFDMASKNDKLMAKIVERARNGELGFSYDLKDAPGHLDSTIIQGETILVLDDFKWRGATILRREAAAYMWTRLAAHRVFVPASSTPELTEDRLRTLIAGSLAGPEHTEPAAGGPQPQQRSIEDFVMDEKKLKEILDASLAPFNASLVTLTSTVGDLTTRLVKVEAAQASAAPAPGTKQQPPAPAPAAGGARLNITDLAAAITNAVKEGNKDLLKAIQGDEPGSGQRMTLTAAQIDAVQRFGGDAAKDDPSSIEAIEAAVETVNAQFTAGTLRRDAAGSVIAQLRAAKRAIRLNQAAQGVTN
jgi:hypothetical protein